MCDCTLGIHSQLFKSRMMMHQRFRKMLLLALRVPWTAWSLTLRSLQLQRWSKRTIRMPPRMLRRVGSRYHLIPLYFFDTLIAEVIIPFRNNLSWIMHASWQNKDHFKRFMDSVLKNATKLKSLQRDLRSNYTSASAAGCEPHCLMLFPS